MAKDLIALDIGTSRLTMALFAVDKENVVLDDYSIVPLSLDPNEENREAYLIGALEQAMENLGVSRGDVALSVSSQHVLARFVKLPPVADAKKMHDLVRYEAEQIIPFPMDEVVWGFQAQGEDDGSGEDLDTIILAVKKDHIDELTADIEQEGLSTKMVDVSPISIFNAFQHSYPDLDGCSLIVDIGARSTDLIFVEDGKVFTRTIGVGGNAMTQQIARELDLNFEAADQLKQQKGFVNLGGAYEQPDDEEAKIASKCIRTTMTKLHAEINRAINLYRGQQSGSAPERVFITGGCSVLPYLDTFLNEKLGLEVEYLNPFSGITLGDDVDEDQATQDSVRLAEVIGLGLRESGVGTINLNLMPQELVEEREFQKKQGWMIAALACILASVGLWAFYHKVTAGKDQASLQMLTSELDRMKGAGSKIATKQSDQEKVKATLDTYREIDHSRDRWVRMLSAIQTLVPDGVWISSIDPVTGPMPVEVVEDPNAEPGSQAPMMFAPPPFFKQPKARNTTDPSVPRFDLAVPPDHGVLKLHVQGLAYTDKIVEAEHLNRFLNTLANAVDPKSKEPLFSGKAEDRTPSASKLDDTRSFELKLILKDPIQL